MAAKKADPVKVAKVAKVAQELKQKAKNQEQKAAIQKQQNKELETLKGNMKAKEIARDTNIKKTAFKTTDKQKENDQTKKQQ